MSRLFGAHPLRVAAQLVIFSLLVGCALTWLGVTPADILDRAVWIVRDVWEAALHGMGRFGGTIALGAMVVVPLFVLTRLSGSRH